MEASEKREMMKKIQVYSASLCAAVLFYFLIKNFPLGIRFINRVFRMMTPFIYGFIISFLMLKPMQKIDGSLKKILCRRKDRSGLCRGIAIGLTFLIVLLVLFLISSIFFPQLIYNLNQLIEMMPEYITRFEKMITRWEDEFALSSMIRPVLGEDIENMFDIGEVSQRVLKLLQSLLPKVISFSTGFTNSLMNVGMGVIISIYFLSGKERFQSQIKKVLYACFHENTVKEIFRISHMVNDTFRNYIAGQLLDALIVGLITFVMMLILRIPLAFIIGVLIMITNIVPMIGPFLGGIPSFFLILMVDPIKALWFVILVTVLQQIDGNIIAPKIVGDSTGLSGFWVLLAIFLGGAVGGISAIVIAVPVMSVIYTLAKEGVEKKLEQKNLPVETEFYEDVQ
ncbi:MAG: AI-2E family transporter [Filifactor alocis]|nr:AI-2E family transporter [Filifactor alocis]